MVAVSDCDERVSPTNVLKHLPPRFSVVRSIPPSKNSDGWRVWPTLSSVLAVSHGVVIEWLRPGAAEPLVVAQMASRPLAPWQSPPLPTAVVPS